MSGTTGVSGAITSAENSVALAAAAASSQVQSLLSPSGIIGAGVSDILSAASDVAQIANTASAALSNFLSPTSDPIQSSFSQGQPYPGTFITAPTVILTPLSLINQALSATNSAISLLSCEQLEALGERVGFEILNDTGLAQAMSFLFNEVSSIANLAFSIALDAECLCGCTDITQYTVPVSDTPIYYNVPSITQSPNLGNLTAFVSAISGSFPNTQGISGIVASVWVDGLSISVNSNGTPVTGVPQNINNGVYNDITNSAVGLVPTATPVAVVDYSYQQNLLNTTLALSIDNGLISTINSLLASPLVTPVTNQVIVGRLGSVAARGDTALFTTLIGALGADNVPNQPELMSLLISSLSPTDLPANPTLAKTIFYAGGVPITTTANAKTLSETITDVNTILTTLGLTAQEVFSQSTCNSIFCSNSVLNIPMIKAANQPVITSLLGQSTVQMANMFS